MSDNKHEDIAPEDTVLVDVKELRLELLEFATEEILDGTALQNLKISVEGTLLDMLKYKVSTLIPAEKVRNERHVLEVQYPRDWWQAFKLRYFTDSLLSRWPVIYTKKSQIAVFTAYFVYPMLPKVMEGVGKEKFIIIKYVDPMRTSETDRSKP